MFVYNIIIGYVCVTIMCHFLTVEKQYKSLFAAKNNMDLYYTEGAGCVSALAFYVRAN